MSPSNSRAPTTTQAPSFRAAHWPVLSADDPLPFDLPEDAVVIGVGESAHFVVEHNHARVDVVRRLHRSRAITHVALEVGADEIGALQAWLDHRGSISLHDVVGPLTYGLYGTFLTGLRDALGEDHGLVVLGVDLPNSLTVEPSLRPLSALVARLDPDTMTLVDQALRLASPLHGGSAAASAFSWMELGQAEQDALTVCLARLRGRVEALGAVAEGTDDQVDWERAGRLVEAAATTDLMLRAMADLFSGGGLPADTTLREKFIARRLLEAVDDLGPGQAIAYLAHNNHVQKSPVVFDGVVAAFPVGQLLAQRLAGRYWCLALTHLDTDVPEMVVPAPTYVGFRVERTSADLIAPTSIEAAVTGMSGDRWFVQPVRPHDGTRMTSIRSQSAVVEVPTSAFDGALVSRSATTDRAVVRRGVGDAEARREVDAEAGS